jgi:hypothetical protein
VHRGAASARAVATFGALATAFVGRCVPPAWGTSPASDNAFKMLDRHDSGAAGLTNECNTCYMNSTLQLLYAIPETRAALMNGTLLPGGAKAGVRVRVKNKAKLTAEERLVVTLSGSDDDDVFVVLAEGLQYSKPDLDNGRYSTDGRNTTPPSAVLPAGAYLLTVRKTVPTGACLNGAPSLEGELLLQTPVHLRPAADGGSPRGHLTIDLEGEQELRCAVRAKTLPFELRRMMYFLHYGQCAFFDMHRLADACADLVEHSRNALDGVIRKQHDAHEFIAVLLDFLEDEMRGTDFASVMRRALRHVETKWWVASSESGCEGETWKGGEDASTAGMLLDCNEEEDTLEKMLGRHFSRGTDTFDVEAPSDKFGPKVNLNAHKQLVTSLPPVLLIKLKRFGLNYFTMMHEKVCHYMIQPLVELYRGCMVVLKVSWCGITSP